MTTLILAVILTSAQALPPGAALPPPGAVRPPSLQQQQLWREPGGPPSLPKSAPLILVPQNQFLLPSPSKEIQCTREVGADIASCKIY